MYKEGANYTDQNKISELERQGHDVEDISNALLIQPYVVRSFMSTPDESDEYELPDGVHMYEGELIDDEGRKVEIDNEGNVVPIEE